MDMVPIKITYFQLFFAVPLQVYGHPHTYLKETLNGLLITGSNKFKKKSYN